MNKNHKIISCAGFGGTGSSAITDLLSEFDGIKGIGNFEFTIMHDVDGILDLKKFLVDDFHRLNSTEAIYRFEKLIKNLDGMYRPYLGDFFMEESKKYIQAIIDVEWMGYWQQHLYRGSKLQRRIKYKIPERIQKSIHKLFIRNRKYEYTPYYLKKPIKLSLDKEKFIYETKKYINTLINKLDSKNEYEWLVLDQLATPYNTDKYFEFFDDLKIIVVDRDPRDLYLLNKIYWKEGWIPSHDLDIFIKWFKGIRDKKVNYNSEKVMNIMLEDLIYNYDETMGTVIKFLDLDESKHIYKLTRFNPEKSKKNCRLWEKESRYKEDCEYILKNLEEYCYSKKV